MNWGMKIVLGMGAFMVFIVCTVLYMVNKDTDTLIDENYYENGLVYDEIYARKQNLQDDDAQPRITIQSDTLILYFSSEGVKGELNFLRSSDGSLDKIVPLYTLTNVFKLPIKTLKKGSWILEVNWESNQREYLYSQSIFIQ